MPESLPVRISAWVRCGGERRLFERSETVPFLPVPGLEFCFCDCCDPGTYVVKAVCWEVVDRSLYCELREVSWNLAADIDTHFSRTGWTQVAGMRQSCE
jgi:hypothetical protein